MKPDRQGIANLILTNWWVRHTLFWVIFFIHRTIVLFPLSKGQTFFNIHSLSPAQTEFLINSLKYIPGMMLVVYSVNEYFLPKLLMKKKFLLFALSYVAVTVLAIVYTEYFKLNFSPFSDKAGANLLTGRNVLPFVQISMLGGAAKLIRQALLQEIMATEAKKHKLTAELELLKAQIHPHFLFNTLNNLFAHTIQGSPESSRIAARLSELLRFMVYESKAESIELKKEIELLNNYIDLEKIRYGNDLMVTSSYTGEIDDKLIAPLLLLPLVENSFKHGTSQQLEKKWIDLQLSVERNRMFFRLTNSRDEGSTVRPVKGKKKGIGIENVTKRLQILYPGKHEFTISQEDNFFMVSINLELDARPLSPNLKPEPKMAAS
jgi:sensor histidine kinase YesM